MHRQLSGPKADGNSGTPTRRFHRLKAARSAAGLSRKEVAQRMDVAVGIVREEEESNCDLSLADLQRWQRALKMPLSELMESAASHLSEPTRERGAMLRLARTATLLQQNSKQQTNRRLASRMLDQLHELMPELRDIEFSPAAAQDPRDQDAAPQTYSWLPASQATGLPAAVSVG